MTAVLAPLAPSPAATSTAPRRRSVRLSVERWLGIGILAALTIGFIVIPLLSPYNSAQIVGMPLSAPSAAHPFGTDQLGRDVFVRTFEAGRIDLGLIVVSISIAAVLGAVVGLVGAYLPAFGRAAVSRVVDATMAFPYIVLVLGLAAALGTREIIPGLPRGAAAIAIAIVIACWPPYARLTMNRALLLRERDSVIAARVLGYRSGRILFRHIGPSLVSMNVSYAATQAVATTSIVGSLAFLGVGIAPPTPELGQMMADTVSLLPIAWWAPIIPGIVVLLLGIGFALLADSTGKDPR